MFGRQLLEISHPVCSQATLSRGTYYVICWIYGNRRRRYRNCVDQTSENAVKHSLIRSNSFVDSTGEHIVTEN